MTSIHVLGAGTPTPTPNRFGAAFVVKTGSDQIMLDCGPAATHKLVKSGLWPTNINHLFFTHHHFDHDIDYPCFLLCRWDQSTGKEDILKVYGPKLTEQITRGILDKEEGLFAHDWIARVNHPLSQRCRWRYLDTCLSRQARDLSFCSPSHIELKQSLSSPSR